MDAIQLANKLEEMCSNAPKDDWWLMIRLFGIRYADVFNNTNITAREVVDNCSHPRIRGKERGYVTEINKGIGLAKYVAEKGGPNNPLSKPEKRLIRRVLCRWLCGGG